MARDHRGVAEAVRCGWADVGVCLRLVSEEAGLSFLEVRQETYELCYAAQAEADPRIRALVQAVRSPGYRHLLADLPGYDSTGSGEVRDVT
jgi:molybdate-binding protein